MFANPPDVSRDGFLRVLDEALSRLDDRPPVLAASSSADLRRPGDPPGRVNPVPRLSIVLEGSDAHAICIQGRRQEIVLSRGHCIYFSPDAWTIPYFNRPTRFFGLAFHPHCVRFVQVILTGEYPKEALTPWAYHTAQPLGEAGLHVVRALNFMAEQGQATAGARELVLGLLKQAQEQLAGDLPAGRPTKLRSIGTWGAVRAYISEHFSGDVSRKTVGHALGLHPNYLSILVPRVAGHSFREEVDQVRIGHARQLLRDSNMKVASIGRLCGYADGVRFCKAFRRITGVTPTQFRQTGNITRPLQNSPPVA